MRLDIHTDIISSSDSPLSLLAYYEYSEYREHEANGPLAHMAQLGRKTVANSRFLGHEIHSALHCTAELGACYTHN